MGYQGSRLLEFIADSAGIQIDQFNFFLSQIIALVSGLFFRSYLKPCPQNTLRRHLIAILWGIILGHFCFGGQMWHLFFQAFVSYLTLEFCPRRYVHLVAFVFNMGYLSGQHIYRLIYDYGNYTLDITSPMMIFTQKLTSLAFAYHDGMKSDEDLSPDQRSQAIRHKPHIIEFLSYVFNFQGIIVGPLCYYQDYIDFINGNNILKKKKKSQDYDDDCSSIIVQPSVVKPVLKKLLVSAGLLVVHFQFATKFTTKSNISPAILSSPIWFRIYYFYLSLGSQRAKYYLAWVLGDAVNNASGMGFNGYDENGNARWDLVTNINIFALETSTSMKSVFDNWNIQTQLWLRRIAYDRLSTGKTLGVFVLSAFWHGFYPGYYMTFVLAAFSVYAGRGIRRKIRPYFQKNTLTIYIYALITWAGALWCINYSCVSFMLLEFWLSCEFYGHFYWCTHIFCLVAAIALPGGSTKPKKEAQKKD